MRAFFSNFKSVALAALALSALLSACGSDTEIAGPNGLLTGGKGNDAIGSLDGASGADAVSGSDAGFVGPDGSTVVVDAIVVTPDGSCAGRCGKYNPNWTCQCDTICVKNGNCCGDIQQVCAATPAKCGDGKCTAPETAATCPMDCKTGPDPIAVKSCLEKACGGEYAICAGDPECGKVLDCAVTCTTNMCLNNCAQGANIQLLQKTLVPLLQCGQQSGCYGSTTGPVCGDGKCSQPQENGKTCPQDCGGTTGPICGDGKCSQPQESAKTCPQDCGGMPGPVCGDGMCTPGETPQSCPQDCGGTIDPGTILTCLEKSCASEYKNCVSEASCSKVLACTKSCTDMDCVQACAGNNFTPALVQIAQCGQQTGCFDGGSTQPPDKCGDGTCDKSTETSVICPADCKPTQTSQCIEKTCPDVYYACGQSAACFAAVNCVLGGKSPQQCIGDPSIAKQAVALLQCGQQSGCFGGTTTNSCQGKCGQAPAPGQACGCSSTCAMMGNCCPDYKQVCGTVPPQPVCGDKVCSAGESSQTCPLDCGPPKPVCGDGLCDPNYESSKTCPADCGTTQIACKSKADCASDEVCCIQSAGQVCVKIGTCN